MSFIQENEENITVFLSIGETIEYYSETGMYGEGEVLEIDESSNSIKVLPLSEDSFILVPTWISADDIIPF
ncbi:MAG: hypothetical protein RM368_28015 [Nostoc sp. DedSLP03]|uniref:hypothetical protein n=1 Tax=Nostoc sp. DedSLP03 TaxID=3075400 RepID=UPI002AD55933|nr:hypothetical protein [Nostoc sp. DedSLP03]MDZ7968754.1 hypothetical protein [Nostoc sp. DedSLP03]